LLFRVVGVRVLPLRFEDAQRAVRPEENIIGPAGRGVEFKADLPGIQQVN
jgi:hypothetical protein